jgi:hypothetical protein
LGVAAVHGGFVDIWSNLAARAPHMVPKAYARARPVAAEETGLPLETFPETCPWTAEQVLSAPLEGPRSPFFAV